MQAWSVEATDTFDLGSELGLWFSGRGSLRLQFTGKVHIQHVRQARTAQARRRYAASRSTGWPVIPPHRIVGIVRAGPYDERQALNAFANLVTAYDGLR